MSGYVWYSFGSDQTGPALGTALGFDAGKKTPDLSRYAVVVGWGCKPGKKYDSALFAQRISQGHLRVLNHPEAVHRNRNKLETLKRLREADIAIPGVLSIPPSMTATTTVGAVEEALKKGSLQFPLIGLNEFNRGEPIFCYTLEDVKRTRQQQLGDKELRLSYFRTYDHGDDYRVHVFRDTVLFVQKKVLAEDPVSAASESLLKKLKRRKEKEGATLSASAETIVRDAIGCLASEIIQNASHLKKSVSLGWDFVHVGLDAAPPEVMGLAVEALDAVELDMGAVSISYADGVGRVLSITTAPALAESEMEAYVSEIQTFSGSSTVPEKQKPAAQKKEAKASSELMSRIGHKLRDVSAEKAEEVLKLLEGTEKE